jgi:ATP-binding cassette subfamily C protein CydD
LNVGVILSSLKTGVLKVAFTSSLMLEFIAMLSFGLVALELGFRLLYANDVSFFITLS